MGEGAVGRRNLRSFTPCEVQNTDAREPKGTEAGTAQISTFGGKTGAVVVALDVAIFCTFDARRGGRRGPH